MPNLKTKLERLAVAEESREMLSYITAEEDCFAGLLHDYLLIWIDDLLSFADTIAEYMLVLEKLFDLVHELD
ncbi:hypothetical protein PHMEG_0006442 [Phytophthora megakarya]|uniref:Reverse transcriptase n=1 Tax=Phytophthora megakarya TaxID=4795 RepID=A0A225WQH1_9STRA|nr:hypothetical protein PHMEG_0006442 [Phytophthora megakarya]